MCCFRKIRSRVRGQGSRIFVLFLLLAHCYLPLASVVNAQEPRPFLTDKDQFNYAMFLYKQGHYTVSAREFSRVIDYFPGSPVIPRAQYMMGNAYLNASMYKEAVRQFQQLIRNFSESEFKAEVSLKLEIARKKLKETAVLSFPKLTTVKAGPAEGNKAQIIMAVQVALFEGKNYKEVAGEMERLKAAGMDTIILRVFHNRNDRFYPFVKSGKLNNESGVYFNTTHSPVIEDILGPLLYMAHKKGLKVFAWMTTRYANYGLENKNNLGCKAYDFSTKDIVPCKGLDLFNKDAVEHLERLFNDLSVYPLDGILFQDDLVLRHNEGFGPYAQLLFERDNSKRLVQDELYRNVSENSRGGYSVDYTDEFWRWAAWKNKRLLDIADRLRIVVKKKSPDVKFAINLMYESISNPPYAMAWLSQSLDEAVKQGFDYYAVMAYHQQMQDELKKGPFEINKLIADMTYESVKLIGEPEKVLIKLQTIDWNTSSPLANKDVIRLLKKVKGISNVSFALAPYIKDFPFEELGRPR